MRKKPRIALNADYRPAGKDGPAYTFLAAGYYNALIHCGAIPIILPPLVEDRDIELALDAVQGIVLVGGSDLDPQSDGYMRHPATRPLDPRRERFDRRLVEIVAKRRLPTLAIGVGMQLLNISQGGTLHFHIPEDLPKAMPHKDQLDPGHRHGLEVVPGTLMERIYGDGELRVNSSHHMALDDIAPGFHVTARAPDGVVEAIESTTDDWFAVGTQFHPESDTASALDMRIFEELVFAITGEQPAAKLVA